MIVVNSVTKYDLALTPANRSYLQFNGCTNFSSQDRRSRSRASSCSSDATGVGAGMAGLIYSAALNARDAGRLDHHPNCERTDGSACVITANEVRQLMASGTHRRRRRRPTTSTSRRSPSRRAHPAPRADCTDPNRLFADATANRPVPSPARDHEELPGPQGLRPVLRLRAREHGEAPSTRSRDGDAAIPPEVEITSPDWYDAGRSRPGRPSELRGQVYARGARATAARSTWRPGSRAQQRPHDRPRRRATSSGLVQLVRRRRRTRASFDGVARRTSTCSSSSRASPPTRGNFDGTRARRPGRRTSTAGPNTEPYGFTVRVIVTQRPGRDRPARARTGATCTCTATRTCCRASRRRLPSDGESSPRLVDLDGDNRNELVFGTSRRLRPRDAPDGSELPGWPVRGDPLPLHTGGRAFTSGEVDQNDLDGAILASVAAADLDRDGAPEVVGADMEGKVYVWDADGTLRFKREVEHRLLRQAAPAVRDVRTCANPTRASATGPSTASSARRCSPTSTATTATARDRRRRAWTATSTRGTTTARRCAGFPVLVDRPTRRSRRSIRRRTRSPSTRTPGEALNQGAIIDTPAVGDLDRRRQARDRGRHERGVRDQPGRRAAAQRRRRSTRPRSALLAQSGQLQLRQHPPCTRSRPNGRVRDPPRGSSGPQARSCRAGR